VQATGDKEASIVKAFRSLLFVPANRPERFAKAIAAGPDAICIDLEDAVPPHEKANARPALMDWLVKRGRQPCAVGVRINGLNTLDGFRDVVAMADDGVRPDFIMVPKAYAASALDDLREALGLARSAGASVPLWAVVESVAGLRAAAELAKACGQTGGVLFGGADFSAEIGTAMGWEALFHARSTLAVQCRMPPTGLLDVPFLDINDADGLRVEAERVRALGFTGKACIHPSQVAMVNAVFAPSEAEIGWAKRVIAAGQQAAGGAILLDGKLLDTPVYLRAERILSQSEHEV